MLKGLEFVDLSLVFSHMEIASPSFINQSLKKKALSILPQTTKINLGLAVGLVSDINCSGIES